MDIKKILSETGRNLAAHWLTTLLLFAMSTGLPIWTAISEHWSWPLAIALGVVLFAVGLWIINGIVWLRRQTRPSKAKITFDYSYGIALDDISPSIDPNNETNNLEFRFQIRNVAPGPIKYKAERIDVVVDDRIKSARDITGTLPRNSWIQLKVGGYEKKIVDTLPDRVAGTYEFSIIYGHPDDEYSRRCKKKIRFDLIKHPNVAAPWLIQLETDESIA